jgi:hypothetical protein
MPWVKRNLYFLISCVLAVALLLAAGWYCYSEWSGNSQSWDQLTAAYEQLKQINNKPVTPSKENIEAAKQQSSQALELASGLRKFLMPIPSVPNSTNIDDRLLAFAVRDMIGELTRAAAANHVTLQTDFAFSFTAQRDKAVYSAQSREHLAREMGEVRLISGVLFTNRISSLESIQRERTADDGMGATTAQAEYLDAVSVTNNNTIVSPYQVSFLCFDQELAGVLAGFANEQHGIMVRTLEVEPAETTPTEGGMPMPMPDRFPPPSTTTPPPSKGGLPIVVDERKLRVTMLLELVRIGSTPGR